MRRKGIRVLVIASVVVMGMAMSSCSKKLEALHDLEKLTARIEKADQADNWSAADWDDALQNYAYIFETLKECDLNEYEGEKMDSLQRICNDIILSHTQKPVTSEK